MPIYGFTHSTQSKFQPKAVDHRSAWNSNTAVIVTVLFLVMVQGLLFSGVTTWVTERRYFIFNLLPFNLYPSDLFFLPFLILYSFFTHSIKTAHLRTKIVHGYIFLTIIVGWQIAALAISYLDLVDQSVITFVTIGVFVLSIVPILMLFKLLVRTDLHPLSVRWLLLLLWGSTWLIGFVHGFLNDTVNLLTDMRQFLLRPLVILAVYSIGSTIDFPKAIQWLFTVSFVISIISFLSGMLKFTGINLSSLIASGLYGELGLLLPYALALSKALSTSRRNSDNLWGFIFILALGIVAPLSKPAIGGFIICTVLCVITANSISKRLSKEIIKIVLFIILLACVLLATLSFTGGADQAENYFRTAYLKQNWETQDLSGTRFSIWRLAIETWLTNPISGLGMGYTLTGEVLNLYANKYVHSENFWTHNFVLQMLYQIGLFGAGLVIIGVLSWTVQARHVLANQTSSFKWIHQGFISFVLTIITMSLYGQFIDHPISGFMLWVVLGLEAAYATRFYRNISNQA